MGIENGWEALVACVGLIVTGWFLVTMAKHM